MGKKRATKIEEPPMGKTVDLNRLNWARSAHNYLMRTKGGDYTLDELNRTIGFVTELLNSQDQKKYKIGVMLVCINQPYWQYGIPVIDGIKKLFLPGHETEVMLWADFTQWPEGKDITWGADKIFDTQSIEWPYPTLMRYHLFLKQEEYLKQFDYLFYIDLDMRIVNVVGDEILGEGLTAAPHPGYYVRKEIIPPYEPNPASTAYIPRPGGVSLAEGKPRFIPHYYAGGMQGGKADVFIQTMKTMQKNIDTDMANGYIAIWNDESHWNKCVFEYTQAGGHLVMLDPSYVYPDSLVQEYYTPKVWGRNFTPRIITLTKPFSISKEGGEAAAKMIAS